MFGLRAHIVITRVISLVLESFSPYLCSGTLISLLFRVKDFANSNSRFSHLLHPGEPLNPMIACFTGRCRSYSPINSRDPMCPLPFSYPTIEKFLWTLFIHPVPVALVV